MDRSTAIQQRGILGAAYIDFNSRLNAHAFSKLHDKAVCDDLVQDTFLKTWKYILKGGKIEAMKAFLYHILNNLIIDQYRRRKMMSLDALLTEGFDPADDSARDAADAFDGTDAILRIGELPEKYRSVMRMKYVELLTLKEMSLRNGQSSATIAVQVHRAIAMMRRLILSEAGAHRK